MGSIETKKSDDIRRFAGIYQSVIAGVAIKNERQVKLSWRGHGSYLLTKEPRGEL